MTLDGSTNPCPICKKYQNRGAMCDACWELKSRIEDDPDLAERFLAQVRARKGDA